MQRKITNIAHRGASSYAPENTRAAFDMAINMGVKHIELDVHSSKDDRLVVIHDDTLNRTTNGNGKVNDHTLKELKALDAGSWFGHKYSGEKLCTLKEILVEYKSAVYLHVEIKGNTPNLAQKTCDMIRDFNAIEKTIITSFWKPWLIETRKYAPEIKTGWLVPMGPGSEWNDSIISDSLNHGFNQICPRADLVTAPLVTNLHDNGFEVRCHGV
ncbi:MAG TPA: glycerophosphodiester phosphodiesterase, partial [Dehalococcoidia bacterium]|nr:glycerophosphodiester phosphodiesterase [Dehalococcoidia bacterium]